MSLASGTRTIATTGLITLAVGFGIGAHGVIRADTPRSLVGVTLIGVALTLITLVTVRRWVCDTSADRAELARTRRELETEHRKSIAAQAAIEAEHAHFTRALAAERARMRAVLEADRVAMRAALEDERLQLQKDAFRTGVEMERSGALKPDSAHPANLIQFPKQHEGHAAEAEPVRGRSREHGVVGP